MVSNCWSRRLLMAVTLVWLAREAREESRVEILESTTARAEAEARVETGRSMFARFRQSPLSSLFPYTTLFRSVSAVVCKSWRDCWEARLATFVSRRARWRESALVLMASAVGLDAWG